MGAGAGRYWIGTIQESIRWTPPESLSAPVVWLRGQKEIGQSGNGHWQLCATFNKPVRLATVTLINLRLRERSAKVTGKLHAAKQQKNMSGKTRLPSMELDLNWGEDLYNEIEQMTGMQSENQPRKGEWKISPVTFMFDITFHSELLLRTVLRQILWREPVMFSGDLLELERVEEPGKRQEWRLTLRIREPNGGVVTRVRRMLSLMNLEEELTSPICYDGLTVIQSVWKRRDLLGL